MTYQEEKKRNAEMFADEMKPFFDAIKVVQQRNDISEWDAIATKNGKDYRIFRQWEKNIALYKVEEWGKRPFDALSSYRTSDIAKKYEGKNFKVPSQKKIDDEIAKVEAIFAECTAENEKAKKAHADFLAKIKSEPVKYDYDYENEWNEKEGRFIRHDTTIKGGEILKKPFIFEFSLEENGYIRQTLKLHYSTDNDLETFQKLTEKL